VSFEIPRCASGFRLRAPAALTPAKHLNLKSRVPKSLPWATERGEVVERVPVSIPVPGTIYSLALPERWCHCGRDSMGWADHEEIDRRWPQQKTVAAN